ncbi:class I SAM-dependent methyltransferase [Ruegeria sp. SCP11]|uniref:class I SAM-dependent methyltransferase n=1 Tax=Ruegeria sp. SCP11 TaxID=3141378 RepID=UPI0033350454
MPLSSNSSARSYGTAFHAERDSQTRPTARIILSHLFNICQIKSVCDVGCGVGTWLSAAQELGAESVLGFEGPWVAASQMEVDPLIVKQQDLEQPIQVDMRFDLVMSLEVAEHLTPTRGPSLVAELCNLSDLVLFSAAILHQGGTGHKNERWQSYWAGLFDEQGFDAIDAIRPLIWNDKSIPWWYRQNMLLYVRRETSVAAKLFSTGLSTASYVDVVHPDLFMHAEKRQPARALKRLAGQFLGGSR